MIRNGRLLKAISVFLLVQCVSQIVLPTVTFALTSGPSQPEFSSFEPVATTNMVDEFTGDFTYNLPILEVPGPQGSGYPLSLSYHSGVTQEEEASWVGLGWTLNAGAINRSTRGIPDDFNGAATDGATPTTTTFYNKRPKNWTVTLGGGLGVEAFGKDLAIGANANASASIRYNNYRGFGYTAGLGLSLGRGLVSMGYSVSDGNRNFSTSVNPYAILSWGKVKEGENGNKKDVFMFKERDEKRYNKIKEKSENFNPNEHKASLGSAANLFGSSHGIFSYTQTVKPNIVQSVQGKSFNLTIGLQGNVLFVPVGGTGNVSGTYSYQSNQDVEAVPSFGYMYSSKANESGLMDYHVENEQDFNPKDVFIGVPFNDADNFVVSGEGIGGGFRMYHQSTGHFGPRRVNSHTDIYNVGGEIGAGLTFGSGFDIGVGSSDLDVGDWVRLSNFSEYGSKDQDDAVFFRFNGDLGGEWGSNIVDDNPLYANFSGHNPRLSSGQELANGGHRSGRSSHIVGHTNREMMQDNAIKAYSRITRINDYAQRSLPSRLNLIGEITIFNGQGMQYNYGLPVFSRNEKSLSFSARGLSTENNFIAYTDKPNEEIKQGQEQQGEYASTYLLTEVLSPDYVDLGFVGGTGEPGSSIDDLGGYTRFNYEKLVGSGNDNWYNWRMPYQGLIYNEGSKSDALDNTVSYSEGEREIYMLHSIETKTHVAIFRTSVRDDSREAASNAFNRGATSNRFSLRKLDRIDLYAIEDIRDRDGVLQRDGNASYIIPTTAKPIKTVRFEYGYKITSNVPNFSASAGNQNISENGKLTLLAVYFEYNGITNVRVSPYEFVYQYPDYSKYPNKYKSGLEDVTSGYRDLTGDQQNPAYNYFLSDAWGNYQVNGGDRFLHSRPWLDQNKVANAGGFDPASGHLKIIKLPSGGEIHVQYEQDDYSFVQDQPAHVMAGLNANPALDGKFGPFGYIFAIDLKTIGFNSNSSEADFNRLKSLLEDRYIKDGKKIYFKFLYRLIGQDDSDDVDYETVSTCNAEYISGYASVANFSMDKDNLQVFITLKGEHQMPSQICEEFVKSQRLGKISRSSNCDPSTGMNEPRNAKEIASQLGSMVEGIANPAFICRRMDARHSYFRIPIPFGKKGGGVRVKRLMMSTNDLEGQPVLYGSEYIYKVSVDEYVTSSGVATNEPAAIREENILVDFVAQKRQNFWERLVAGRNKDMSEGPIGETVLPGPSVGYSRIVVRNIHSGKSSPGFTVTEFYTAREKPIKMAVPEENNMTEIQKSDDSPIVMPLPFRSIVKNKTRRTQGFSYIVNGMHGQLKSQRSYQGTYFSESDIEKGSLVSSTLNTYFSPGEKVPLQSSVYEPVVLGNPGREVDVTFAQRKVKEHVSDVNIEADLQVSIIPLLFIVIVIPYPSAVPSVSTIDGELNTHATSKVVRYPAILKSSTVYQDGITHTQENLAFDKNTGRPVAVKTDDEFNGAYVSHTIPAAWEYPGLSAKWRADGRIFTGNYPLASSYLSLSQANCDLANFIAGDLLGLNSAQGTDYCYVTEVDWVNRRLKVLPADGSTLRASSYSMVTIVKTARTNQLALDAGSYTVHHEAKANAIVNILSKSDRYASQGVVEQPGDRDFVGDLKNAINQVSPGAQINLPGPYKHLDMTAFAGQVPTCVSTLVDIEAKEIKFLYDRNVEGTSAKLRLVEFSIRCGTEWVTVKADGWE